MKMILHGLFSLRQEKYFCFPVCNNMSHLYVIPLLITSVIAFSWYNIQFFRIRSHRGKEHMVQTVQVTSRRPNIPTFMWDIYYNGINSGGHSHGVDIIRNISPKFLGSNFPNYFYPNHGRQEIEFSIPEERKGETLVNAEIRIPTNDIRTTNLSFQIYHREVKWFFLDVVALTRDTDWISFNVTSSVKKISNKPTLLLSYVSGQERRDNNSSRSYSSYVNDRPKRNIMEDYEANEAWENDAIEHKLGRVRNTCRRKSLYIEFSDIDYDTWIVAPTGYEAFQCVGRCIFPVGEHLSPTKHAIVQTLMHHVSPKKVGRPCCVPTRLDPISILYVDNKGILTYRFRYHGMVVAECGCR